MTKLEAIAKAKKMATTVDIHFSKNQREENGRELARLFKEYGLTWLDIN